MGEFSLWWRTMLFSEHNLTKSIGFEEWRGDLKGLLKESGGKNRNVVFLFSDSQIKEEYFLQDIDSLLNTGEVPNIFPIDEISEIYEVRHKFCYVIIL